MATPIASRFDDLSLQDSECDVSTAYLVQKQPPSPAPIIPDEWVFGFHLKNKYCRRFAEKNGFNWKKNPFGVIDTFIDWLASTSKVPFRTHALSIRGKSTLVIMFAQDDSRRRTDRVRVTNEQMDKLAEIMGIPKGRKPKWYDVYDEENDPDAEVSSDDERPPPVGKDKWTVSPAAKQWEDSIIFASDESDSEDEESDESVGK